MNATILLETTQMLDTKGTIGYIFGAVIAILFLGYLFYSHVKPEKFKSKETVY